MVHVGSQDFRGYAHLPGIWQEQLAGTPYYHYGYY